VRFWPSLDANQGIQAMEKTLMLRNVILGAASLAVMSISTAVMAQAPFGTAAEAQAMLAKAVDAVKADKAKALDLFQKGEGGFKDRDLYPFCANVSDGIMTAHPALKGKNIAEIKDKNGKMLGEEMQKVAVEGKNTEVSYVWPRPGADVTPVAKVTYVTKVGDQLCGVGFYK
jgi:Single Cache domain 2